jgi:hypothetical protein
MTITIPTLAIVARKEIGMYMGASFNSLPFLPVMAAE